MNRRSRIRPTRTQLHLLAAGVTCAAVASVAIPALAAPSATPVAVASACPPAPAAGSGGIAGYTISTLATGLRYQVNSPGLLPVGDATEGNVTEADVPFARMTVSQGPLVDATASPAYPGDTAAHLGTAVATFGGPPTPNDPILAEASYPPSPGHSADETFNGGPSNGGVAAGAGSAHSTATAGGGTAQSSSSSSRLSQGGPGISSAGSDTATRVGVGATCVDASAQTTTGAIDIGGIIKIGSVSGSASARSDGTTATPHSELSVGRVTVAGLGAFIDRSGIHLNAQQPVGAGVVDQVQSLLQRTLSAAKLTVHLVEPTTSVNGAAATATSGGLAITGDRQLPAAGVPGLPSLSLPGVPPVPLGTPPLPLHVEIVYGAARVAVAATTAGPLPAGVVVPVAGPGAGPAGPPTPGATDAAPPPASDTAGSTPPIAASALPPVSEAPGATVLVAGPIRARPHGAPVPVSWVVIGSLLSVLAVGPGLGYARWQLLDGRSPA